MSMSPRLLRPRPTGFNPKSISGLKLWLDVANGSSMTLNGSTVSQINDLSGNGFHATQGTANNQPTYQAAGFNLKPTLLFDTNDIIATSAKVSDYVLTPTTSPTFTMLLACYMPPIASSGNISFGSDNQANGRVFFSAFFGGSSFFFDVAAVSGGRMSGTLTASSYTSPVILTAYRHGARMALRRNGADVVTKTDASANFSTTTGLLRFPESTLTSMYLSEVIVYASALSASDITKAEQGLGKKWGVAVA